MSKRSMIGISNISQNHWHPCCQEKPDMPIDNTRKLMKINSNIPTRGKQNTVNRTENIYYMDTVGWSEASEDVEWENNLFAYLDYINVYPDCNNDLGGSAYIDDCGICSEGLSGHIENSNDVGCGCFARMA